MSASELRLYHLVQLAAHRLKKAADRELAGSAGVTTAQAAVLAIVAAEGTVRQRRVAQLLGFNESALTAMIGRLRVLGLIERRAVPGDRRAFDLVLSEAGRDALGRAEKPFGRINTAIDEALSPEEQKMLASCLRRLANAGGR